MTSLWPIISLFLLLFASWTIGSGPFTCMTLHDLDVEAAAFQVLVLSELTCAHKCVVLGKSCDAFHHSGGHCFLLKASSSWSERYSKKGVKVYIKAGGENPKCTPKVFPKQWERSRYAFIDKKTTWAEAAVHCEAIGGKLMQLSSPQEAEYVKNLLQEIKADYFTYNGAMQLPGAWNVSVGWVWHLSGDGVETKFWAKNEPNDWHGLDQDVGTFFRSAALDDALSSSKYKSICECFIV